MADSTTVIIHTYSFNISPVSLSRSRSRPSRELARMHWPSLVRFTQVTGSETRNITQLDIPHIARWDPIIFTRWFIDIDRLFYTILDGK